MNKKYVITEIAERIVVLEKRYYAACLPHARNGAQVRHATKRDTRILQLIQELVRLLPANATLSEDSYDTLYKLLLPVERHRREEG